MLFSDSISRFRTYYQRNGLKATVDRASLFIRRSISANRMIVFYWDLTQPDNSPSSAVLPDHLTVERKNHLEQIDPQDWRAIVDFWNPKLSSPLFAERLQQGASLWLLRSEGKLAACGWSVIGRTLEPYYYPLAARDGYLYDFLVFPEYRGRKLNSWLITHILHQMAGSSILRAHFEVAEWNRASLSSTAKTGYRRYEIGIARKASLFGRTIVQWARVDSQPAPQPVPAPVPRSTAI